MRPVSFIYVCVATLSFPVQASFLPGTQPSQITLAATDPTTGCNTDNQCKGNRICQAGTCTDSAVPLPPPQPSLSGGLLSSELLIRHQIQLLEFNRLSLAGPLFVTIFGAVGFTAGGVMLPVFYYTLYAGFIVIGAAALPLAIGLVWLFVNIGYNHRIDLAIRKLREEQDYSKSEFSSRQLLSTRLFAIAEF